MPPSQPFVRLNVAITADGKIAPASRVFVPFGSARDHDLLYRLRSSSDAVMAGARTVDLYPTTLGPGSEKYRKLRLKNGLPEYNVRVVVSGSGSLDPKAEIFKKRHSPILLLTSGKISSRKLKLFQSAADEVGVFGEHELDFPAAMRWLSSTWSVKTLVCEGGGALNDAMLRAGLVDEVYVTVCPLIFGGRSSPTLADGLGFPNLADAAALTLKSQRRVKDELFLVYSVRKPRS
ncbi:MAG TPA: dihydrofolate reductase family protein [Candidatus Saccharimonadales bacterium]|nr:dihydrofolate reductase family protein [Candidatus Saccharimonadales bacterium]